MTDQTDSQPFTQYDQDGDKIINQPQLTPLQQQYLANAKKQHRNNMTKIQKIGTKVFTGAAFIAKPEKITFKDFQVGKPHYLTLTLTNVSNAFNSFNVLPLPQKIRNYFQLSYTPKGKISPGISCQIKFKFLPQINEDINSQFTILAETGEINFQIICSSKKAIVKCKDQIINFGKIIQGEIGNSKLYIHNQGALKTSITVKLQDGQDLQTASEKTKNLLQQLSFQQHLSIDGYSQNILTMSYTPTHVGQLSLTLQLYIHIFLYSPPILLKIKGQCIKVPVTIQKYLYNFQICLLSHIYRQKLTIYNTSDMPMSFKVTQPPNTKKYFQFSPVIGYVQKQSKINIWVKFIANKDLAIQLISYLKQINVYQIPFQVEIKEQVLPVAFIIRFQITSDEVIIKPAELNFGSIFQGLSSKIQVSFQNQSDLPQQILLSSMKSNLSIENDQALFKILPKHSIKKYIRYRTKPLENYKKSNRQQGSILCKIITGEISTNQLKIDYNCQIIKPDLSITDNHIDFQVLQINQLCSTSTHFKNNINKDIIFEIFVPPFQICGLKITPVVKILTPNQQVQINIQYHSFFKMLGPTTLRDLQKKKLAEIQPKIQQLPPKQPKQPTKKQPKKQKKLTKAQQQSHQQQQKRIQQQTRLKKQKQQSQKLALQQNFNMDNQLSKLGATFTKFDTTQHYKWVLPVYFKKKDYPDASAQINFLEITTTSTQKILVSQQMELDFGEIPVGTRKVKQWIFTTLDPTQRQIKMNQLPIFGCFSVLNSLRMHPETNKFKIIIEFQPRQNQKFQQRLTLFTTTSKISCLLKGIGARPDINIIPQTGIINFGGTLLNQSTQKILTIKNISNFQIDFTLQSLSQGIPNLYSSHPFLFTPSSGKIPSNSPLDIKIQFKPDRIHQYFYQKIKILVPQQKNQQYLFIYGYCYPRQAFVKHYREISIPDHENNKKKIQYTLDSLSIKQQQLYFGNNNKIIILQFLKQNEKQQKQPQQCFKKKLIIGSCKLLDNKLQKPTNFQIIMPKDDRFQCDILKGTVTPGNETIITFTYKPQPIDPLIAKIPVLLGVGQWKDIKLQLKISGGFVKPGTIDLMTFELILRVYMAQL